MSKQPWIGQPWRMSYPKAVDWSTPVERTTLPALLARSAVEFGPRCVIEYHGRHITYQELAMMVDRTAAAFLQMGVGPGGMVALYLPNTPYHPIAFFAATKLGARIVLLSPLDAERELAHKLRDSGARVIVTVNAPPFDAMAERLADAGLLDRIVLGDDSFWHQHTAMGAENIRSSDRVTSFRRLLEDEHVAMPDRWPDVSVDDIALIQYTGGTTGVPKGAVLTHGNVTAALAMTGGWHDVQPYCRRGEDKQIGVLPLFHIYGLVMVLLRSIRNGDQILLRTKFDVDETLRDIEQMRATWLLAVPTMLIALAARPDIEKRDFSSLRFCASGGAPLPSEVAQRFEHLTGNRVGGGWGMTETAGAGTALASQGDVKAGLIGLPLPNMTIEIVALDDPQRRLQPNEVGELRVKGPNVARGYWNRREETAGAFCEGYLLTGDIGYMDEDGRFFVVDRKKDMIISGGFNVYPRAIEEAISEHASVEEVLVIGVPDPYRGEAAKAYIKLRAGASSFSLEELRQFLTDKLGRHELPSALAFRDALPRTAVGKLSKKELVLEARRELASQQHVEGEA